MCKSFKLIVGGCKYPTFAGRIFLYSPFLCTVPYQFTSRARKEVNKLIFNAVQFLCKSLSPV